MKTTRPPRLESLERRDVPATFGLPWADAQHLTVSFVPDGTDVHGRQSELFKSLKQQGLQQAEWQAAVLRAVQTWTAHANINVGVVQETGKFALGADGAAQGDPRFGDIRIAGVNLGANFNQLAITVPHDPELGTLAGDIIINTGHNFGAEQGTRFDLSMVMLQEIGHAFGLGNSPDRASVMYETYQGVHGLADSDIDAIQALYGARAADTFKGGSGKSGSARDTDGGRRVYAFDGRVGQSRPTTVLNLNVTACQVIQFDLEAKSGRARGTAIIRDAAGQVVETLTANGDDSDVFVLLNPGTYTVELDMRADRGRSGKPMAYALGVKVVSDPIDAYVLDPTEDPLGGSGGSSDGSLCDDGGLDITVVQAISRWWAPW